MTICFISVQPCEVGLIKQHQVLLKDDTSTLYAHILSFQEKRNAIVINCKNAIKYGSDKRQDTKGKKQTELTQEEIEK